MYSENHLVVLCPTQWHVPDFNDRIMEIMRIEYMDRAYFSVAEDITNILSEICTIGTYQALHSVYDAEWTRNESHNLSSEIFQQLNMEETDWVNSELLRHLDFLSSSPVLDTISLGMITSARTKLITAMSDLYHLYKQIPVLIDVSVDDTVDTLTFKLGI